MQLFTFQATGDRCVGLSNFNKTLTTSFFESQEGTCERFGILHSMNGLLFSVCLSASFYLSRFLFVSFLRVSGEYNSCMHPARHCLVAVVVTFLFIKFWLPINFKTQCKLLATKTRTEKHYMNHTNLNEQDTTIISRRIPLRHCS